MQGAGLVLFAPSPAGPVHALPVSSGPRSRGHRLQVNHSPTRASMHARTRVHICTCACVWTRALTRTPTHTRSRACAFVIPHFNRPPLPCVHAQPPTAKPGSYRRTLWLCKCCVWTWRTTPRRTSWHTSRAALPSSTPRWLAAAPCWCTAPRGCPAAPVCALRTPCTR